MRFLNRVDELNRLQRLSERARAALAVIHGRRRVGKTRLLLEWCGGTSGVYAVADQSSPDIQRRYLADAVGSRLPAFGDVAYPDWSTLLTRLARDASAAGWRGPIILDELPYLVATSPELPSVLQRWLDHDVRRARLIVALAGSSQRMMQGLVLSADAPLYGRADELFALSPLAPEHLADAFDERDPVRLVELYAAWGGIPRYWELARELRQTVTAQIRDLVLDPLGPLHREPDRLLLEELPPALETRPILDAIGAGMHRVSEIAGRMGSPATSLSRPLERLVGMGLVRREVPFGEPERKSKRSLYRIDDPFFRLWFRVVAPHRGMLAAGSSAVRLKLLQQHWPGIVAQAWEDLCRRHVSRSSGVGPLGTWAPWQPASRWWLGNEPEWDVVSRSLDGTSLLLGEVKWQSRPLRARELERAQSRLASRTVPATLATGSPDVIRVLFVPALHADATVLRERQPGFRVVTARDILR